LRTTWVGPRTREVDICADALWYQAHPDVKIEELELTQAISRTSSDHQQ